MMRTTGQINNLPALKVRRRQLRSFPTPAEARLWKGLRRANLDGRKFRRQHSVGPYILDFYCPECRLAVELDGQAHFTSMASEYDLRRMRYLESLNIRVLRFENRAIFDNPEGVLHQIGEHLLRAKSSENQVSPPH